MSYSDDLLEDIETRLYNQIYHSNQDDNSPAIDDSQLIEAMNSSKNPHVIQASPYVYKKTNLEQPQNPLSQISIKQLVVVNHSPEEFIYIDNYRSDKQLKRLAKKQAFREKRRLQRKQVRKLKRAKKLQKIDELKEEEVIVLSDSDESIGDSCVEIPQVWPTLSISDSDDDGEKVTLPESDALNTSVDDVIFVEPASNPPEIINVDEDESNKLPKTYHPSDRLESCTPDSTSNDFMVNPNNIEPTNHFNFALHGADFRSGEFLKPPNRVAVEDCSFTSSSSTTCDINTLNTSVFTEIDFPKDNNLFVEDNLENFSRLITPKKRPTPVESANSIPSSTPKEKRISNVYESSESSSESDLEQSHTSQVQHVKKSLPNLSHFATENLNSPKNSKKKTTITSKYDLLDNTEEELAQQVSKKKKKPCEVDETPKKKKKKKKLKSVDSEVSGDKAKKRKSNEFEESEEIPLDGKKKAKKLKNSESNEKSPLVSKRKKKKRTNHNSDSSFDGSGTVEETNEEDGVENAPANELTDSSKKRKKRANQNSESSIVVNTEETLEDIFTVNVEVENPPIEEVRVNNPEILVKSEDLPPDEISSNTVARTTEETPPVGDLIEGKTENSDIRLLHIPIVEEIAKVEKSEMTSQQAEVAVETPPVLEGFIIVDETFSTPPVDETAPIPSEDSDSNLSALSSGNNDIQLGNCSLQTVEELQRTTEENHGEKQVLDLANASVEDLQKNMSDDPNLWKITQFDVNRVTSGGKGRRCNKCREYGHIAIRCPNKAVIKCRLCGGNGHYEPRCPNRICTQCGKRSNYSTTYCKCCFKLRDRKCSLCRVNGHESTTCPDLWRRYHLTTKTGPIVNGNSAKLKPRNQLWCSGCAKAGHLEYMCSSYKPPYPAGDPRIKSYDDVYGHSSGEIPPVVQGDVRVQREIPPLMGAGTSSAIVRSEIPPLMGSLDYSNPIPQLIDYNNPMIDFSSDLPNYISFESNLVHPSPYPNRALFENPPHMPNRHIGSKQGGFRGSVLQIQQFVGGELAELHKLSINLPNIIRNLSMGVPYDYRVFNMILFGLYKLHDGQFHLDQLKNIRMLDRRDRLSGQKRHFLYKSYEYIFGGKKHPHVDYEMLLHRL